MLVTVPVPVTVVHDGFAAAPPVERTCPDVPGFKTVHTVALRYKSCPCVVPIALSISAVSVVPDGDAADAVLFPTT